MKNKRVFLEPKWIQMEWELIEDGGIGFDKI
jgi:hypothetical protein